MMRLVRLRLQKPISSLLADSLLGTACYKAAAVSLLLLHSVLIGDGRTGVYRVHIGINGVNVYNNGNSCHQGIAKLFTASA